MTSLTNPALARWRPALGPAALASLLIHLAIAGVLTAFVSMRPIAWGTTTSALTVELVAPAPKVELPPPPLAISPPQVPDVADATAALPQLPMPPTAIAEPPLPVPAEPLPAQPAPQASLTLGQIRMGESYAALSGFPEELMQRSQAGYLIEVDKLAQIARNPDVVYPADALKAKREGTVVVWLALSREGAVEETIVVSGEPEFAAAVESALPSARFLPAVNGGETVPFYIIITFEFRGA